MVETFSRGEFFFIVDCDFFSMAVGGGRLTKWQQNYSLIRTKLHHLKRDSRECMPPEHLTNAECLSNIYSKRTILK